MCVGARLKVAYVNRWTLACACCGVIVEGNRLRGLLLPPPLLLTGTIVMSPPCLPEKWREIVAETSTWAFICFIVFQWVLG
jgi:hypothetical protein